MDKMDITPILNLIIRLVFTLVTIFLIPRITDFLKTKVSESDQKKLIRWVEIAVQAAEEAERSGLIDRTAKYGYAKRFLEARGITFDADTTEALINSAVWDLINQFREDAEDDSPEKEM